MKRLGLIGLCLVGLAATASGQQTSATTKDDVPAEYRPPKGMCRIWVKDVPPKQQPAPTDCAAAVKNVPQNGRVIFSDADGDKKEKTKTEVPKDANGYAGKTAPPPVVVPKKPPLSR
jgi:hypothetical protein